MITNFINEYPYTNLTYANIDWLIKKVKELSGDTEDTDAGIQAFLGAYANEYPYSNLTYANIDWLIKNVGGLDAEVTKLSAQVETLQADVDNATNKLGDKVDKLDTKNVVYATDNSTPAKTIGIQYMESPFEGTIPIRDSIGSLQVPTAQDATQAVNKGQMDTALDGKLNKTTNGFVVYGTGYQGVTTLYSINANNAINTTLPLRTDGGRIVAADPYLDTHVATKKYVDSSISGWTRVVDKVVTKDIEIDPDSSDPYVNYYIGIADLRPCKQLRAKLYINTPQEGAVFEGNTPQIEVTGDDETFIPITDIQGLPETDKTPLEVKWASNGYKDEDGMRVFTYAGNAYDKGIPTPNERSPLSQSTITYADTPTNLDSFLANRIHEVNEGSTEKTYTYNESIGQPTPPSEDNILMYDWGILTEEFSSSTDFKNRVNFYTDPEGTDENPIMLGPVVEEWDTNYTTWTYQLASGLTVIYYAKGRTDGSGWQKGQLYTVDYSGNEYPTAAKLCKVESTKTVKYTTNDYYATNKPDILLSQVIAAENGKHIGELVNFGKDISACTFNWSGETSISYKQIIYAEAAIIDESLQTTCATYITKNTLTSFDSNSIELQNNRQYYNGSFMDGTVSQIRYTLPRSTSNGVTARKIYAGTRLVLELKY